MSILDYPPVDTVSMSGTTPARACVRPDTFFDGARWRCRGCDWTSPRDDVEGVAAGG